MRQKCLIKNHTEEIEWNKWKVKFRTHSVEMPTLYTSCLETLEVQIKITTACNLNPHYHTKQPRFIRLIFYFSLNMYNCVSFSYKYSIVHVSVQKTCKTEVFTHFHILLFCLYFFFFQAFLQYADLQCIFFFNLCHMYETSYRHCNA